MNEDTKNKKLKELEEKYSQALKDAQSSWKIDNDEDIRTFSSNPDDRKEINEFTESLRNLTKLMIKNDIELCMGCEDCFKNKEIK